MKWAQSDRKECHVAFWIKVVKAEHKNMFTYLLVGDCQGIGGTWQIEAISKAKVALRRKTSTRD